MLKNYFINVFLISILLVIAAVNNSVVAKDYTMPELARQVVMGYLSDTEFDYTNITLEQPLTNNILGVFVTVLGEDKVSRGCWGELYPQMQLKEAIAIAAIGAIKKDYRFKPVNIYELPEVKFQVSLVVAIEPVSSLKRINPYRDGLLVKSGGKAGILMPGEAVDAHYQMVQCKLKAGIQPGEPFELFKLVTKIYKEKK